MDDYLSEKEQIEQLKTWWSEYGAWVISGVVVTGLGLFGWNYYQGQQRDAQLEASALYDELTDYVVDGDVEEAEAIVDQLEGEHADLAYTSQARLAMARLYMDRNRDQDAADILRELMESNANQQFRDVARLRLSKVLLYQGKADEVVELLADNDGASAFAARFSEALGDAHYELGDYEAARVAYNLALIESAQGATVDQQFVTLKLLDLPAATDDPGEDAMSAEETADPMAEPMPEPTPEPMDEPTDDMDSADTGPGEGAGEADTDVTDEGGE
ncbi:MAG: tetratricopeptide repeat protein [Woeseiaceae bacterium]|nr:tetratricopeptide repeat protein [Woeseiaceae bacterium]